MKKLLKLTAATALLCLSMASTVFAGAWRQNEQGAWWWEEDDHSYPSSTWAWIDSDGDGISEFYYFDENGYLLTNTITPTGGTVNELGQLTDEGIVRQRATRPNVAKKINEKGRNLYKNAIEKNFQLNSMDYKELINEYQLWGVFVFQSTLEFDVKYHNLNSPNIEFLTSSSYHSTNNDIKFNSFYTNDYLYRNYNSEKTKTKADYKEICSEIKELKLFKHFSKSLNGFQIANDSEGNTVIFFSINIKDMDSYMKTHYSELMAYDIAKDKFQFNQFQGKAIITPDGYLLKEVINPFGVLSANKHSIDTNFEITIEYNHPGQDVTIDIPSLQGYEEVMYD